jgi:cation diffusion facilitator CzcD-associated flavoprotein CzcO
MLFRYPGCKCDIPAHNYSFSFSPNEAWPNYYATSEQIHAYLKDVAAKYEVEQYIRYQHSIIGATWNEEKGKWEIQVERPDKSVFTDECDVFVNASGVLK